MNPYPIYLADTRLLEKSSELSTAYRCKVIQGPDGAVSNATHSAIDMNVPWGQIGVCYSDLTWDVYAPEDAETYWASR